MNGLRDRLAIAVRKTLATLRGAQHERSIANASGRGAVLCYHRVLPDDAERGSIHPGMYVRASTFAAHLRWLQEWGRIVPLDEILVEDTGGPRFALTFDDGWQDNATVAWPLLRAAGVPALIFLVEKWVSEGDRDGEPFLDPELVRNLYDEGLRFGAHTVTHPHLDKVDAERVISELESSKRAVERWTGAACNAFAFPYGDHNGATLDLARERFEHSWLTGDRWVPTAFDRGGIPRICIHDDMTATRSLLRARLAGAL
jgi:peptidoglycan/xylan/chitin deacetylase (PgdA/CDA1 family)